MFVCRELLANTHWSLFIIHDSYYNTLFIVLYCNVCQRVHKSPLIWCLSMCYNDTKKKNYNHKKNSHHYHINQTFMFHNYLVIFFLTNTSRCFPSHSKFFWIILLYTMLFLRQLKYYCKAKRTLDNIIHTKKLMNFFAI